MKELIVDRIHFSLKLGKLGLAQAKAFHALRNSQSIFLFLMVLLKQVLEHSSPSSELTRRDDGNGDYLAYSMTRVSRMRVTRTSPGCFNSASMVVAIFLASS